MKVLALLYGLMASGWLGGGHNSAVKPIETDKEGVAEYLKKQMKLSANQPISKRKLKKKRKKK